jgi:hypothetical protein
MPLDIAIGVGVALLVSWLALVTALPVVRPKRLAGDRSHSDPA